jgi:predicted enzyme related to lactoylglutathione lyase
MAAYAEDVPCWADAFVPDVGADKRFHGALFGWTFQDDEVDRNGFTIALNGGGGDGAQTGRQGEPRTTGQAPMAALHPLETTRVPRSSSSICLGRWVSRLYDLRHLTAAR